MRLTAALLILLGIVATGVGGWGHIAIEHFQRGEPALYDVTAHVDPWPIVASYLGLALVGAMFLAMGLLVSSLVRSQMVAALVSLVLSLVFIFIPYARQFDMDPSGLAARTIDFIGVPMHFSKDFTRGVIDTRHLTLYASVAVFSLFMTVRSLESRRWH
jgi:hypothetical protein